MGIRGLTTFVANRAQDFHDYYELHDTYLVVDGYAIACQMYRWHAKCNDCFGGDYDKYAKTVISFVELLKQCNVTPLMIFDGAYEKRKLKTVYTRIKTRISDAKCLNSATQGYYSVFPLFMRELFIDILLSHDVKCVRCDFEGDTDAANLARRLNCPILSYDSDFYIMDVIYIPFNTIQHFQVSRRQGYNYIRCDVYRVDKFLRYFGGMNKVNLPLLAVLLGNDYIKKSVFKRFYKHLKIHKNKENEQQRTIKSLLMWLKHETPESALTKILGRYKLNLRRRLTMKINAAIRGYNEEPSQVSSYFKLTLPQIDEDKIKIPNPEEVPEIEDNDTSDEEISDNDDDTQDVSYQKPGIFEENYRKCVFPSAFMEMMSSGHYFFTTQIEDFTLDDSQAICNELVAIIYKILLPEKKQRLICVTRSNSGGILKYPLEPFPGETPTLEEIHQLSKEVARERLLSFLKVSTEICEFFPESWHFYLIGLKYWVQSTKIKVDISLIYSIVLCGIALNFVDSKIGFYRSTRSFFQKFGSKNQPKSKRELSKVLKDAITEIDEPNAISCQRELITYFQMEARMRTCPKYFNRRIVHQLAEFQSCLFHIRYLNAIFNFPFPMFLISCFYDGTFIYNMAVNLARRGDLRSYFAVLFKDSPSILNVLLLMIDGIEGSLEQETEQHAPVKKRKKRRRTHDEGPEEALDKKVPMECDEEYQDDNNVYSLLASTSN